MAEQQICTFFLKGIYFGIDVQHVQEVIRPQATTPVPLAPPDIYGLINLRGQIITVIDLQRRLEMSEPQTQSTIKLVDEPDSRYVEKPTRNLTPQPPSLVRKLRCTHKSLDLHLCCIDLHFCCIDLFLTCVYTVG